MRILNILLLILQVLVNSQDQKIDVKLLSCAYISKLLYEDDNIRSIYANNINTLSSKIGIDSEKANVFFNLLILNQCTKSIKEEQAKKVINIKNQGGEISKEYLKLFKLNTLLDEYFNLNQDEKNELFQNLGRIKEGLSAMSNYIDDDDDSEKGFNKSEDKSSQNKSSLFSTLSYLFMELIVNNPVMLMILISVSVFNLVSGMKCKVKRRKLVVKKE